MANSDVYEEIGQEIDKIDNILAAMELPMSAEFHLEQLKKQLPEISKNLKGLYVELTDNSPWDDL